MNNYRILHLVLFLSIGLLFSCGKLEELTSEDAGRSGANSRTSGSSTSNNFGDFNDPAGGGGSAGDFITDSNDAPVISDDDLPYIFRVVKNLNGPYVNREIITEVSSLEQGDIRNGKEPGETITPSNGYAEENVHCDYNKNGVVDNGEMIDFPDHTFAMVFRVPEDYKISIEINREYSGEFFIDYGDGECGNSQSHGYEHFYINYNIGDFVLVRVIGNLGGVDIGNNLVEVANLGDVGWKSFYNSFTSSGLVNFYSGHTKTDAVKDYGGMFSGTSNLRELNTNTVNFSNITNMTDMFSGTSMAALDLRRINTSKVTSMLGLFNNAKYLNYVDGINSWDTSNVVYMDNLFSLTNFYDLDLSNWNTENVTSMSYMFSGMKNLAKLNVSNFNTSNVTNFSFMFDSSGKYNLDYEEYYEGVGEGPSRYNLDLSSFSNASANTIEHMFHSSTFNIVDLSGFEYYKPLHDPYYVDKLIRKFCPGPNKIIIGSSDLAEYLNIFDLYYDDAVSGNIGTGCNINNLVY